VNPFVDYPLLAAVDGVAAVIGLAQNSPRVTDISEEHRFALFRLDRVFDVWEVGFAALKVVVQVN